ncbi:MAG TPA: YihY/virulence factor BrkB family protein [Thermoanaerobaculia bacterium]|nr:YihY/virulence factor BrkB family protein [Thermoanaerobaculia bacterium]
MKPGVAARMARLARRTFEDWREDKAQRLGAALAYYAVFSIVPLLAIVVAAASLLFEGDTVREIEGQIATLVTDDAAHMIAEAIRTTNSTMGEGLLATALGLGVLLFGASGVFAQLQDAMNTIWEVKPRPRGGFLGILKDRFLSFTMVLGIGFLLVVSLAASAGIAALSGYASGRYPGLATLWQVSQFAIAFALITVLFALMFKILPDARTAWKDVWIGAAVTALLFNLGKFAIGVYLGRGTVGSAWGAAGAVLVLLLWVYYSAQILLLGAEFTQVYATEYGAGIVPKADAKPVTERRRAQEGMAAVPPEKRGARGEIAGRRRRASAGTDERRAPRASPSPVALVLAALGFTLARRLIGGQQGPPVRDSLDAG